MTWSYNWRNGHRLDTFPMALGASVRDLLVPNEFYDTIGWASVDQLIVITGAEGEQILQAVDPFTGSVSNVAPLTGQSEAGGRLPLTRTAEGDPGGGSSSRDGAAVAWPRSEIV